MIVCFRHDEDPYDALFALVVCETADKIYHG